MPYQDRQTSRLTICSIPEGSVKGDYIILNVGDAIYILQYGENEGVPNETICSNNKAFRILSKWFISEETLIQLVIASFPLKTKQTSS